MLSLVQRTLVVVTAEVRWTFGLNSDLTCILTLPDAILV